MECTSSLTSSNARLLDQVVRRASLPSTLWIAAAVVMVVRAVALIGLHVWSVAADRGGFGVLATGDDDDGRTYFEIARHLADGVPDPRRTNGFPTVLSWLMRLGLDTVWELKIVNTVVGLVAVAIAAAIVGAVVTDPIRRRSAMTATILLVGLYPSNVFIASHSLYRDAWILAGVLGAAGLATLACRGGTWTARAVRAAGALATLAALAWFRPYAAAAVAAGVGAGWVADRLGWRPPRQPWALVAVTVGSLSAFFVSVRALRAPVESVFGRDPFVYRDSADLVGGSDLGISFDSNVVTDTFAYLVSFVSNAFGPLPWQVDKPSMLLPFLLELPMFTAITWVLVRQRRRWASATTQWVAVGLLWLAMQSVWNDNLGAALRFRSPAWSLLALAAVVAVAAPAADLAGSLNPGSAAPRRGS